MVGLRRHSAHTGDRNFTLSLAAIFTPSQGIWNPPAILGGARRSKVPAPIFQGITHFANPKLEHALTEAPVMVTADPAKCSFQFKATGTEKFTTPCDIIKAALVGLWVNYENVVAPPGTVASVKIGEQTIAGDFPDAAKAIAAAINAHGYPAGPTRTTSITS